jgi:hypothetical protein
MKFIQLALIALASIIAFGSAATALHAELAPDAQQAINRGIVAAGQQDYLLAIRYFGDARKLAPDAPEIYYDLGLAESRIPGRELRAVAWFAAYLSASPNAQNATAVRGEIDTLDIKSQSNLSRLIKSVQDSATQMRDNQEFYLGQVAGLWTGAGDMTATLKVIDHIKDAFRKDQAWANAAEAQMNAGDMAGALKSTEQIQVDVRTKTETLDHIAKAQVKAGDVAAALKTFMLARTSAEHNQDAMTKHNQLEAIAGDQADAGDIAGAQSTLAAVGAPLPRPDVIKNDPIMKTWPDDKYYIDFARDHIAEAQIKAGDIAGAQKTAALVRAANLKPGLQKAIEAAIAKSNLASPASAARPAAPAPARPAIPAITVSDWLGRLDMTSEYDDCPLNTDLFLDWAGYLKGLHSDNPETLFSALRDAAGKIIKAQNIVDRMLKSQVAQKTNP